ncbi:hypothetical protein [Sphingobium cupriresistens]|uniref:hypothetical protein n=1 Tax=Sphingobium cupriresistens TaxID=1132417 RepID=UPI001F5D7662|nr:hypothetical protein [Sphingobium cupriresistens]
MKDSTLLPVRTSIDALAIHQAEPRSNRAEVRNPVLALPAARIIAALEPDARAILAFLLRDLQHDARQRADRSWHGHKAVMASYWSAVAVYSGHISRVVHRRGSRDRLSMVLRQSGFPDIDARGWAEASRLYCQRRELSDEGASRFPEAHLMLAGKVVARISYNGRIWLPGIWRPGDAPIYDNQHGRFAA